MKDLNSGDLVIKVAENNKKVIMSWLGKSRDREPGAFLNPYFDEVLMDIECSELIINFVKLEYMNSSTVPSIIKLFKLLETKKIPTKILYDKESGWQCASFKALTTISGSLDYINVEGVS